ncbi:sigma 54-interacting transcriptional regulator [Acinetobacter sichuanensis]|uniref:AAA family ATPase n=1 Tax=Acinetobacter sichuanensis TaxID=2136183 RepID=A0A371YQZ0_9GAMM|nr:sigma 54-interacting transcriptional regulator [Acinetobacter sichuanensis]RFC83890.1 AAA family ATPase [Acinetobacter sichuanensis]
MQKYQRLTGWDENSPGIAEIASKLKFSFDTGEIWLDEERMILLHSSSFIELYKELINTLGSQRARGVLTRIGYASGLRDAEIIKARYKNLPDLEMLHKGTLLHSLEGMVLVELKEVEIDINAGKYYVDAIWKNSIESQIHSNIFNHTGVPTSWIETGYATGFVSGITGKFILHKDVEHTLEGTRFIGKPLEEWENTEEYLELYNPDSIVEKILDLQEELDQLKASIPLTLPFDIIGQSKTFKEAWMLAEKASKSPVTVLLLGETGVGKEVFARQLHQTSLRSNNAFVAVNCGALPDDLIESELFGVEKGAYTGAHISRIGRFERAEGGTIFLDEIGELSSSAQTRLLRVLQNGELDRLGDTQTRKIDVRVIAATNVNLLEAVEKGTFRRDLYFRLNVFPIVIPPLRERKEDIYSLAQLFIEKFSQREGKKIKGLTDKAYKQLNTYDWPGNIRELENAMERAIILVDDHCYIDESMLFLNSSEYKVTFLNQDGNIELSEKDPDRKIIEEIIKRQIPLEVLEKKIAIQAIHECDGNLSAAARLMGITRAQIGYLFKKLSS